MCIPVAVAHASVICSKKCLSSFFFFFFGHDTIINYLYVKTHGLCNQACTLCSFVTVQERAAFQSKAGVSICVTFLVMIKAFCLSILLVNLCD